MSSELRVRHRRELFVKSLILFILCLFLVSCENNISQIDIFGTTKNAPLQTAKDIEVFYSDSAQIKLKLTSPLLHQYGGQQPYEEFPDGIHIWFYNAKNEPNSTLISKYAIRKDGGKLMEARDSVEVVNEKGEKLNTNLLIWDENKKMVYTYDSVRITTPEEIIFGQGLESNLDFSKYKIKNITGTIYKKDE